MLVLNFLLLCAAGVLAFAMFAPHVSKPQYDLEDAENLFEDFIKTYNKIYGEGEKRERFSKFKENLIKINKFNLNLDHNAYYGINQFSDLSTEEFVATYTGLRVDPNMAINVSVPKVKMALVDNFDWVSQGAVTPVKNQGACLCCWAFGTTGTIEGAYFIKYKTLLSFSEQQLVDCDTSDNGCSGGYPTRALSFLQQADGIESEDDYPYETKQGTCRFNPSAAKAKISGQSQAPMQDDNALQQFLMENGPVAIGINSKYLHQLLGGIIPCPPGQPDHSVLLVGFGTDENGTPYWLIKNSWGTGWGEEGYFRANRNGEDCSWRHGAGVVAQVA